MVSVHQTQEHRAARHTSNSAHLWELPDVPYETHQSTSIVAGVHRFVSGLCYSNQCVLSLTVAFLYPVAIAADIRLCTGSHCSGLGTHLVGRLGALRSASL